MSLDWDLIWKILQVVALLIIAYQKLNLLSSICSSYVVRKSMSLYMGVSRIVESTLI